MKQQVVVKKSLVCLGVLAAALSWVSVAVAAQYDFEFTADVYADEDTLWAPEYYDLLIRNTGTTADTIDLVVTKEAPPGWSAGLCIHGMCIGTTGWVYLGPNETEDLSVQVYNRGVAEMGLANITGTMRAGDVTKEETFATFILVPSILLVDDDAGGTYETYMDAALDSAGYDAHVWDAAARGRPGAARLASYREVLWTTADGSASYLTGGDEQDMMTYLDGGGNLCLASMGFLSSRGGTTPLITDYLHLGSWTNDIGAGTMLGVTGSAVGDGMSLDLTGGPFSADGTDGAGLPTLPAESFFATAGGETTGVGVDEDGHKVVFLSFPFECVPVNGADPDNQKTLMTRIMDWFAPPVAGIDERRAATGTMALGQNLPNPFAGSTCISFVVPGAGVRADIEIYDVAGRLVRTLAIDPSLGPEASVVWDGKDAGGRRAASGVYFYRLNTGKVSALRKMVLLE
jgi:hypothetical protein